LRAPAPPHAITDALAALRAGDTGAMDQLVPLVYEELARIAHRQLGLEAPGHTLSTTALVHEAYLQLVDIERVEFHDRAHFLAVAATAMRRILVDSARRHRAAKRGGGAGTLSLDNVPTVSLQSSEEILVLDGALEKLGCETQRLARIVELRFFGGLTIEETAGALGVAPSTVQLDWQKAKAWLYRELREA
jgi:RNA polymerase sigma factor (TIGR02999 family)